MLEFRKHLSSSTMFFSSSHLLISLYFSADMTLNSRTLLHAFPSSNMTLVQTVRYSQSKLKLAHVTNSPRELICKSTSFFPVKIYFLSHKFWLRIQRTPLEVITAKRSYKFIIWTIFPLIFMCIMNRLLSTFAVGFAWANSTLSMVIFWNPFLRITKFLSLEQRIFFPICSEAGFIVSIFSNIVSSRVDELSLKTHFFW